MRTPLKTHGGKHYLAAKILPLLPPHRVYVEPFAGGLSVLLRKPWAPVEVAGDLDQELINFYHVLCAQTTNLIDRAKPLAYSREVLAWAKEPGNPADRLDAALRFLVRRRFSRGGLGRDFAWSTRLRGGQPGDQNAWETAKAELSRIAERLRGVQFVCQNAIQTIRQFAPRSSILIIDDNSPDGTGKIADELAVELPAIHVMHRPGKLGLGTAMLEAISFAVGNQYDYLLNLDADFSHPPRFIPALLDGMRDHDVMIGSRYVPGGGVEGGFTFKRKFMSSGINWYARVLLGLTSKDNSGAYRCYRVSKLAQIDLSKVRSRGYSFQEEILYWCKRVGCRIGETPILFENRRFGASKINTREAASALWILLQLGLGRIRG